MAVFDFHLHTHWSYDAFSAVEDYFRLDGIGCAHPKVSPEYTEICRKWCPAPGLLSSGGSHDRP